jgi:hypothetical protein
MMLSALFALVGVGRRADEVSKLLSEDNELLKLSYELHSINPEEIGVEFYIERTNRLMENITDCRARSIEGLYVKARATAWSIIGDFDPRKEETNEMRLVVSLLRDLIQIIESDTSRSRDDRLFRSVGLNNYPERHLT